MNKLSEYRDVLLSQFSEAVYNSHAKRFELNAGSFILMINVGPYNALMASLVGHPTADQLRRLRYADDRINGRLTAVLTAPYSSDSAKELATHIKLQDPEPKRKKFQPAWIQTRLPGTDRL